MISSIHSHYILIEFKIYISLNLYCLEKKMFWQAQHSSGICSIDVRGK